MAWKEFEIKCGFGGGDETKLFGPRQETGSSLYQVDTVASIFNTSGKDGKSVSPWLLSSGEFDKVAVVIENHILLFEDACARELCSFTAEGKIDGISWSENASFLVFVDRSGRMTVAHPETENILISKALVEHRREDQSCFASVLLSKMADETYDLIVTTCSGGNFHFTGLDLDALDEAVKANDKEAAGEIQKRIQHHMFDSEDCHNAIECVTLCRDEENNTFSLLFAGTGDMALSEWNMEADTAEHILTIENVCTHIIPGSGFKKCLVTPDGLYLVVLDTSHQISLWSRQSFCLIEWGESNVEDFNLYVTSSVETDSSNMSQSKEDLKIVVLSCPLGDGKRDLKVLGLPDFDHVYTLKVSSCSALASLPLQQEIIMFLVGGRSEDGNNESGADNIQVKCLMEAIPENRLSRLLYSKKFDEAEKFATTFNMDVQMVYTCKCNYILDQLAPWGSSVGSELGNNFDDLMTQLKDCLNKIEDMEKLVNYCLKAQLPSLEATYQLLNYAREKVRVHLDTRKFTKSTNLFQELLDGINRLVTFETAFGAASFSGPEWCKFSSSCLLKEVTKCFKGRKVNSGFIVWRRHQSEMLGNFNLEALKELLNSIPDDTPSRELIPWLKDDFVPYVLTNLPEGQCFLAHWLEKAAGMLEFSSKEKDQWPDNALEMAEVMYTAFSSLTQSTQERDVATPVQFATKVCRLSIPYIDNTVEDEGATEYASAMKKLANLVKSLREVKSLHHDYNCKLSLDQFSKENPRSIAFHLLDRIAAAELIHNTVQKYVKPYILKNNLKVDRILSEYVVHAVDSKRLGAHLWEQKVIAIVKEIQKKEERCEATLKLMEKAKTPWSAEMEKLISDEMKANPGDTRLERQFQFANLRKMMKGYGINNTNLSDVSKIQPVIRYMFNTDNPNSLEDALEIAKASLSSESFIYSERIQHYIEHDQVEEACGLLRRVPKSNLRSLIDYLLNSIVCTIEWEPLDEDDEIDYIRKTQAAVLIINMAMKLDEGIKGQLHDMLATLKLISSLQIEFGFFISHKRYCDEGARREAVQVFLRDPSQFKSKYSDRKSSEANMESRLKRFAELLGFNDTLVYDLLIDLYQDERKYHNIHQIGCQLLQIDEVKISEHKDRLSLLHKVVTSLAFADLSTTDLSWVKVATDLHHFAAKSLALCREDELSDFLMLAKFMRILSVISSHCESTDFQDESTGAGLLNDWIDDFYKDDSLALSSVEVYPPFQKLLALTFPGGRGHSALKYRSNRLNGSGPFVNSYTVEDDNATFNIAILEFVKVSQMFATFLQDNNHQELALHIYMLGASICSQRQGALQLGINVLPDDDPVAAQTIALTEAELDFAGKIFSKAEHIVTGLCASLVRLILSHRVVDHDLALCYMDVFAVAEGKKILQELQSKFKSKFSRIQNISKVGVDFAALRGDEEFREMCTNYKECAAWGRKLQLLRVPQPWNIFKAYNDVDEKRKILELLVAVKSVDLKSIIDFCELFQYDKEKATFMYLEVCLLPDDSSTACLDQLLDTSYQEKIDNCDLSLIHDQKQLEKRLYGIAQKISSYDYERLTYIFKKIVEITDSEDARTVAEDNVNLLEMLAMYQRTGSAVQSGISSMDDMDDDNMFDGKMTNSNPEIAKNRLPFHQLAKKTWEVLEPELTSEKNVVLLKPIVNKLKMDVDQVCAKAVAIIGTRELEKLKQSMHAERAEGSTLVAFDFSAVENILNMIKQDTIMMAASKWLVKNLPRGPEKVKALKGIINRASAMLQSAPQDVIEETKEMYQRFHDIYKRASCEAALLEFGINDKAYYALCNSRAQLIIKLYEDFGDKMRFETGKLTGAPDIHALASRIVDISESIDLGRIQTHLMNQWLPWIRVTAGDGDDDDGDISLISANAEDIKKKNEKNLRRVIYVLASSYNQHTVQTLLNAVYESTETSSITNVCRMRALQVLFTLVDARSIEIESNMQVDSHHSKLVSCIYLSELEFLHVSHTEESFRKANKENLVKSLWRNHSHEPQGIRLIADICLDYQIFDPQLWNSLLLKLHTFDMIPYLAHVLSLLSGIQQLRELPSLTKMWKAVITVPLSSVSQPLSPQETKICLRCAQLITRCPVILDIGLTQIAALFKKVGLYMQALFCLKLCPDKKMRKESIHSLFDEVGIDVVLAIVKKEREAGSMDPHFTDVERQVFDYVEEGGLYLKLYGSVFFDSLINYLIQTRKINKLLLKTISAGKFDYATILLSKFLITHPDHEIAKVAAVETLDASNTLMRYLQTEGLYGEAKPYINSFLRNRKESGLSNSTLESSRSPFENSALGFED